MIVSWMMVVVVDDGNIGDNKKKRKFKWIYLPYHHHLTGGLLFCFVQSWSDNDDDDFVFYFKIRAEYI